MGKYQLTGLSFVIVMTTAAPSWLDNLNKKMDDLGSKIEDSNFVQGMDEKLAGWSARFDRRIGRLLGKEDQSSLHDAVGETVRQDETEAQQTEWRSDSVSANATITATPVSVRNQVRDQRAMESVVLKNQRLTGQPVHVQSAKRSNIRLGPGKHYDVVQTVRAGTILSAIGQTDNGWYLLEQEAVAFGYIHVSVVDRMSHERSVLSLGDDEDTPSPTPSVLDLEPQPVSSSPMRVEAVCRDVAIELTKDGQRERDDFEVCKDSRGIWEI